MIPDEPTLPPDPEPQSRTLALRPHVASSRLVAEPTTEPLAVGSGNTPVTRLNVGGYELLRLLGRGGMGVVWLARNSRTGQRVALKLVQGAGELGSPDVERFLTEARAGSRLQHPHIVRVLHCGTADGQPFFTMELLFGGTLRDRLRRGPLAARDAARLVRQAAGAIQYAHEHKVLHRDLTPSNLLLTSSDWRENEEEPVADAATDPTGMLAVPDDQLGVKVCDFGLARLQDANQHQTRSGDQIGTPAFMAPEQVGGNPSRIDARTDVYGLGAVLYACLTGRSPFQAATSLESLLLSRESDPIPVRSLAPAVQVGLEAVCLKCLEKEPPRRYQSAAELEADLGRWLDGQPVLARPSNFAERASKWARRNAVVASLTAAIVASLVAGVIVSTFYAFAARREAVAALAESDRADEKADEAVEALGLAKNRLERAEWLLYVAQLTQARAEFLEGNSSRALNILDNCRREFRHIAYHHLRARFCPLHDLIGHTAGVREVGFRDDGARVVSAGHDGTARLWDATSGKELLRLLGHAGEVYCARFAPGGARVATGGSDGTLRVWDADTGKELFRLQGHAGGVLAVVYSPDGSSLASCGKDGKARLWNAATGERLLEFTGHAGPVSCVAFRLDGQRLLTGGHDRSIRLWDTESGKEVRRFAGHSDHVLSVAFSPDGKRFLSGGKDHTARLWVVEAWRERFCLREHTDLVYAVAFSPDGRRFAVGCGDGTVVVRDAGTGQATFTIRGHNLPVSSVAFTADGKRLASGGGNLYDSAKPGEVKVWDAERGQEVPALTEHQAPVLDVAFDRDGKRFVSAGETVRVWDAETRRVLLTFNGHKSYVRRACYRPDGAVLFTGGGDGQVKARDAATGKELFAFTAHTGDVSALSCSRDGSRLLTAGWDGMAKVWDAHSGKLLVTLRGHTMDVWDAAFSPDGARIVTGAGKPFETGRPGEVKLWDARTGKELRSMGGHRGPVFSVAFSPDGLRFLSGGFGGTIRGWDASTGEELLTMAGHLLPVRSIAFTPDGKRVLSAGGDHTARGRPGQIKVWDVATGQEMCSLKAHTKAVNRVAVSPRGDLAISGDWANAILVWDARPR